MPQTDAYGVSAVPTDSLSNLKSVLQDRINSLTSAVEQAEAYADRLDGGVPRDPSRDTPKPVAAGIVGELFEANTMLMQLLDRLHTANARINNKL